MDEIWRIAWKIGLSALLAGAVGAEREWSGKEAGLRTHMLIAVGAALLTDVSVNIGSRFSMGSNAWDPGRIAAQIVSGIGFLGAGTILQSRGGVRGLTTAAGVWVAAAIGLAVGARFYVEATVTTVVLLGILVLLRPVERKVLRRDLEKLVVELPPDRALSDLQRLLEEAGIRVRQLDLTEREGYRLVRLRFEGSEEREERLGRRLREAGFVARPDDAD